MYMYTHTHAHTHTRTRNTDRDILDGRIQSSKYVSKYVLVVARLWQGGCDGVGKWARLNGGFLFVELLLVKNTKDGWAAA